ncbi:hypothetical protein [Croceimicrobium hydrocarbonivorans]|uniref:Uncharacterized protein n=1 Tax=Croceimicrobium hydrocarbonivorans TaxID=2761580 RepID=A0A7H0VFP4_9FLAO|nr:hypothetical protein [Croceimicrobium hydrocarbonivorans]QNR24542.1 hypothetical protein H4K34_01495 [Croceimicrobium hydrocarbonivorans]
MKSLLDQFGSAKNRKSIPELWCGLWIDKNGKQVIIEPTKHNFYAVTVLDSQGEAYKINLLAGNTKDTIGLLGRFATDSNGIPFLQVEAGRMDLGPTYNLYFLNAENNQKLQLANNSDDLNNIIMRPYVESGLYDDWEDDLGVPWAFPLADFKREMH